MGSAVCGAFGLHGGGAKISTPITRCTTFPAKDARLPRTLFDLAQVYRAYDRAEPLLLAALDICRKRGEESVETAQTLAALGTLYKSTRRPKQAEQSFRETVSIFGKTVGGEHPDYANAIENLALICQARRDFVTADALLNRVLEIRKPAFGPEHRDVAASLENLALLKRDEKQPAEAIALGEQALAMLEKILGRDNSELAPALNNLGAITNLAPKGRKQSLFSCGPSPLMKKRSVRRAPSSQPTSTTYLNNLGMLYVITSRYDNAVKVYDRALAIRVRAFGDTDPMVIQTMTGYAAALRGLQGDAEAGQMEQRIQWLAAKQSATVTK
jgi:tetratricopeptide (TPR) repeat protein